MIVDYGHDETLTATAVRPGAVVVPTTTDEVAAVLYANGAPAAWDGVHVMHTK